MNQTKGKRRELVNKKEASGPGSQCSGASAQPHHQQLTEAKQRVVGACFLMSLVRRTTTFKGPLTEEIPP